MCSIYPANNTHTRTHNTHRLMQHSPKGATHQHANAGKNTHMCKQNVHKLTQNSLKDAKNTQTHENTQTCTQNMHRLTQHSPKDATRQHAKSCKNHANLYAERTETHTK